MSNGAGGRRAGGGNRPTPPALMQNTCMNGLRLNTSSDKSYILSTSVFLKYGIKTIV